MNTSRSERDDRLLATVSEWWSAYQRSEDSIAALADRLQALDDSLEGDVDAALRLALPRLAEEVELLRFTTPSRDLDRRLAEAMNRFLVSVGETPVAALDRARLINLLISCREGSIPLTSVRAEARRTWLAGLAPTDDALAHDVLYMLTQADGKDLGQDDVAALLDYLSTPPGAEDRARDRLYDYLIGRSPSDEREEDMRAQLDSQAAADELELSLPLPTQRRLSRAVRLAPEAAWPELAEGLCSPQAEDEFFLAGVFEELLYRHADAFIDRIERLAADCPAAQERIAWAHIGGIAPTPALERFWSLQEKLRAEEQGRSQQPGASR